MWYNNILGRRRPNEQEIQKMITLVTTPPKAYPDDSSPCSATTTLGGVVTKVIISRKEAKEQGLTRYFTGKACPQKHTSERHTSNEKCRGCASNKKEKMKMQGTRYFDKICEKHPELNGERRTSNSGCVKCVYLRSNDPKYRVRKTFVAQSTWLNFVKILSSNQRKQHIKESIPQNDTRILMSDPV